jgi:pentatricopeptide repeat protein
MARRRQKNSFLLPNNKREFRRRNTFLLLLSFLSLCGISSSFSHATGKRNLLVWQPAATAVCVSNPSTVLLAAAAEENIISTTSELQEVRRRVMSFLQANDYEGAKELIGGMVEFLQEACETIGDDRLALCEEVDKAFQSYFNSAFATPYRGRSSRQRVSLGMDLLHLQFSPGCSLEAPYNTIPKRTLLSALKALTAVNEVKNMDYHIIDGGRLTNTDAAYRLLQRLVTGVGVRNVDPEEGMQLYESDFNLVLNAYSNVGRMDMAHRIVALQERTPNAPALSPVAYSILLKGYGRLRDLNNIEMLLTHAQASNVEPDTIMLNSLIDAYVNCNELENAHGVFEYMRNPDQANKFVSEYGTLFTATKCPAPNKRTYNIFLKGLANRGLLDEALSLSDGMRAMNLWDHVTTNTLVRAAVKARDFVVVEELLENHTTTKKKKARSGSHPNAEAYTSAMDGYAKNGELTKAIELLKLMKERQVEPNEFTYTCLIGALARSKKIDQAKRMMSFMKSIGLRVRAVTYNSFISGLVHRDWSDDGEIFDSYVDDAIKLLRQMMKDGIRPNAVTVSVIVDAFGKCDRPRVAEAVSLVDKLESDGVIAANNTKISTALVQVYGAGGDLDGAVQTFQRIRRPDIAAINALLDACVRCDNERMALKTFNHFFRGSKPQRRPDVISYSIIISSLLKKMYYDGSKDARKLYEEMKFRRRIMPDNALVDM